MSIRANEKNLGTIDPSIPSLLHLEGQYRPRWLLSDYPSMKWIVTDTVDKKNKIINFDIQLTVGKRLTDYPHLVETIKRIVYGVRTGPLMQIESGSVQATVASNLLTLAKWMIMNQIERFDELTITDIREYVELAAYGVHSILNVEEVLNEYLNKIFMSAGFDEKDNLAETLIKAKRVLPYRKVGSHMISLNRNQLLENAGLSSLRFSSAKSVITSILDDAEAHCGFYQYPAVKRRMQKSFLLDELDEEVVTTQHLGRFLLPFDYLYRHRRYLNDAIQFTPFPASSIRIEANKLGRAASRTRTIPVKQAATLIERSIRWVIDYSPALLDLKDYADSLFDSKDEFLSQKMEVKIQSIALPNSVIGSPFPILIGMKMPLTYECQDEVAQGVMLRQGMTLQLALNYLLTACATVIAAFSGRRAAEILGLKAGCIEYDEAEKPWMKVFIYKTLQSEAIIPIPEVVAAAVKVLERLSNRARAATDTPYVFQFNIPGTNVCQWLGSDRYPVFTLGKYLRRFGYFIDVPELADGSRWEFRPHQFRRFFAILYIWIYELGDWGALSYHLRHFSLEKTRRYASDEELGHIIAIANRGHTAEVLANAVLGRSQISGMEGVRLKEFARRLYVRMNQRMQVVPERKFVQRLMRFVERADVSLQALPWGYCAGTSVVENKLFNCASSKAIEPDRSAATISTCKDCWFSVRTDAFLPYLINSLSIHREIEQSPDSPQILKMASKKIIVELDEFIISVNSSNVSEKLIS